jgi:hypothetical protein
MKMVEKFLSTSKFVTYLFAMAITVACNSQPPQPQPSQAQGQSFDIASRFVASGFMGDGEQGKKYIQLNEAWKENPHSAPSCIKAVYSPGPNGWGGVYWQNKPDNWGDQSGENFSQAGYRKLTFWARGQNGGEVVEFKAGDIKKAGKPYKDSFEASLGKVTLEKDWKQYTMNLTNKDLSSVIGGFCWVAAQNANPKGITFYLDDILFEN